MDFRASILFVGLSALTVAKERYVETGSLSSAYAVQAAAADQQWVYAVAGKQIAKYDRASGKELAVSDGPAKHLNSAVSIGGRILSAHSNFPEVPEEGDIRVLDPATMKLTVFHRFENPPGSVTWVLQHDGSWWCHFAHYLLENNKSVLLRFNADWKETGRWTYPAALVKDWGRMSLSGAVWQGDVLLATGHDKKVIYRLKIPAGGGMVQWLDTLESPFPGQGIAVDAKTGGLVGIDRKKKAVVFATLEASGDAGE